MKKLKYKYKKVKTKIIKTLKKWKEEEAIKNYAKNNILFLTYVITTLINSTILRFFCIHTLSNYLCHK